MKAEISLSIDVDAKSGCLTIKRRRSIVTWQELDKRERLAVIRCLETATTDLNRRLKHDDPNKYCGKCKRLLPLSAFYKRSDNGKPRPFCKECEMEYGRRYRAERSKKVRLIRSCDNCANKECRERITSAGFDFGKSCVNYKREDNGKNKTMV